jgi:hypothetical protein
LPLPRSKETNKLKRQTRRASAATKKSARGRH